MSLAACAAMVEKSDPDRFRAVMAAPPATREVLFPLFAFNLEVARAPWASSETMIAEMRIQFWRDVADEIGAGDPPRPHEVASPLTQVVTPALAPFLEQLAAARRWDIYRDPFEDAGHFDAYIEATSGNLFWVAAKLMGAGEETEPAIRDLAFGGGVANYLLAVPELEARGRIPLLDGTPDGVRNLAATALTRWQSGLSGQRKIPKPARSVLYALWRTPAILSRILADPRSVARGGLTQNPIKDRLSLMRVALRGRL